MDNLRPWDGREPSGRYQYPVEDIDYWNMQIDNKGTVYYITKGEPAKLMIWCPSNDLTRHLHRLEQIAAR